jgi:ABC-type uncharacterized transport system substrate-binding protein
VPSLAIVADLLRRQVAVIVGNTPSALAAKAATTAVPIVFVTGGDPVRVGLVASLNRPAGNVTGISFITAELGSKQLGLLRELRPGTARIAVLADPKWPLTQPFVSDLRAALETDWLAGWEDSNSEMSSQNIPLKGRTDSRESSRILPPRLFAFELRRQGYAARA